MKKFVFLYNSEPNAIPNDTDMDAAIAIAKTCPSQTGLQIYEAIEM